MSSDETRFLHPKTRQVIHRLKGVFDEHTLGNTILIEGAGYSAMHVDDVVVSDSGGRRTIRTVQLA